MLERRELLLVEGGGACDREMARGARHEKAHIPSRKRESGKAESKRFVICGSSQTHHPNSRSAPRTGNPGNASNRFAPGRRPASDPALLGTCSELRATRGANSWRGRAQMH